MADATVPRTYRCWPYRGERLDELVSAKAEDRPLEPPAADEVLARVEAATICSSDLKVVNLGPEHPLFSGGQGAVDTVLGHELCLRVEAVGADQRGSFHQGQRLGLQPSVKVPGRRSVIIGMDRPGGFAEVVRLGPDALRDNVFEVPEDRPAAEIALLEPYGCVERAYRPNARTAFQRSGRALVVLGPGAENYGASQRLGWAETVLVDLGAGGWPDILAGAPTVRETLPEGERFDDILALGELDAEVLTRLVTLMGRGGMLLQARRTPAGPVSIDAARVHYEELGFVGTADSDLLTALDPARQRFDVRPGGVALVHGAAGAMGRIHIHRLLQREAGPRIVIATARNAARLDALARDFVPMAEAAGRQLVLVPGDALAATVADIAPGGVDDAVVVAPSPEAVETAANLTAPAGLVAVFAGFPFGRPLKFDLAAVALSGKRLTGSTGCSVADMQDVLARVVSGELDLLANVKAVGGLDALPSALLAVSRGEISGKIVIFPQVADLALRRVEGSWDKNDEIGLTAPARPQLGEAPHPPRVAPGTITTDFRE